MEQRIIFLIVIGLALVSIFAVSAGDTSNVFLIAELPQDLNDLGDVMINSPVNDDGIRFEDGDWVNVPMFDQNEVLDLISGSEFDFFLVGDASDIADYNKLIDVDNQNPKKGINEVIVANGTLIASFATEPGEPVFSTLSSGVYDIHLHALVENAPGTKDASLFFQLFEREPIDGNETLLMTSHRSPALTEIETALETHAVLAEEENIDGNRLSLKIFGDISGSGGNPDVNILMEGDTVSRVSLRVPISTFDTRYLKLNASNDPVTGDLDIDADLGVTGNITMTDDNWIGLGAAKGRLVFDDSLTPDQLKVLSADTDLGGHVAVGNLASVVDRKVINVGESVNEQFDRFIGLSNFVRHNVPFETNKWVINMEFELKNNSTGTTFRDAGVVGFVKNVSSGTIIKAFALNGAVRNESSGTIVNAVGNQGSIIGIGSGEITNAFGFSDFYNFTDGNVGIVYGYFADQLNMSGDADVGTHYQFYAAPQVDGDDANYNWGFYQDGKLGKNYFDGNVGMGSTLDVNGNADFNANVNVDENVSAKNFCFLDNSCISSFFTEADANGIYNKIEDTNNDGRISYNAVQRTTVVTYRNVLASDTETILALRTWQDETVTTFASQPAYVRNVSVTIIPGPLQTITGTVTVNGIDSDGGIVQEVFTFNNTVLETQNGDKQFKIITSVVTDETGGGTGLYSVGINDKIGFPNYPLNAMSDVIAVTKNDAFYDSAQYLIDITNGMIQDTGTSPGAGDDYTIWVRPFA